jgi:hypothetical protein
MNSCALESSLWERFYMAHKFTIQVGPDSWDEDLLRWVQIGGIPMYPDPPI